MITHNGSVFAQGVTYYADITGHLAFAGLPATRLHNIYRDGRAFGLLVVDAIEHHFANLARPGTNQDQNILVDTNTGDRLRTKVLTGQSNCDFALSAMLGASRRFKPQDYAAYWRSEIEGWIVIDNRKTPILLIAGVPKHIVSPPFHVLGKPTWAALVRGNPVKVAIQ